MARLAGYCWRYPRNVILALAGTLVVSAVGIAIPLIQRAIVDNLTSSVQAAIWPLAVALLIAAFANFGALYLRRYRAGQLSLDVQHDLRTQILASLSRLDGTRQDELHTGQIVSRSISDITMVQGLLSMVPMLMGNAVLFAGSLIVMAVLSPSSPLRSPRPCGSSPSSPGARCSRRAGTRSSGRRRSRRWSRPP
jgi:ATP-binding cassette subfamily B protein